MDHQLESHPHTTHTCPIAVMPSISDVWFLVSGKYVEFEISFSIRNNEMFFSEHEIHNNIEHCEHNNLTLYLLITIILMMYLRNMN